MAPPSSAAAAAHPGARKRLAGRIALITGASRGIGAAVARHFAAEGAHVVLVARSVGGLEEVDDLIQSDAKAGSGGQATLVPFDLREFDKIEQMAAALYERFGRLDVLVGNAGTLGLLTPLGHLKEEVWSRVIDVNLTANWRLIRAFDPLLKRSDAGRAIFVSSGAANRPRAYWGPYAVSKAALESLVRVYADETDNTPVRVNIVEPGRVRTRMRAEAYPTEDPETLPEPEALCELFLSLAEPSCTKHGEVVRPD